LIFFNVTEDGKDVTATEGAGEPEGGMKMRIRGEEGRRRKQFGKGRSERGNNSHTVPDVRLSTRQHQSIHKPKTVFTSSKPCPTHCLRFSF
jgi:hypothetical protein